MKIIYQDRSHGIVKVMVENLDDLWYLSGVVKEGDLVSGGTVRRIKSKEESVRKDTGVRKTVTLTIMVEKTEFNLDSGAFRIIGVIREGPEDLVAIGSHHTFNVQRGTALKIIKEEGWSRFDMERLKEAKKASLRPKVVIVVVDDGEANVGLVRESKIEYFTISKTIGGKYQGYKDETRTKQKTSFYHELAKFLLNINGKENISAFILAGAGFEKDNFNKFLSQGVEYEDITKNTRIENIGSHGRSGIGEVIKRGGGEKTAEELSAARDIKLVEKLMEHIGKDTSLGIYGISDIENASNAGAVEILLVCDDLFLKERERIEQVMNAVKATRGLVHLVNHENDAGRQLTSLGGIGAVLRYRF